MNRVDEAFAAWGDRLNRDTAHMLDLVIAGTIDQLQGHGTVVLRPARLEEIVERVGPREADADGGWRVTLLPGDDAVAVVNTERTSAETASLAAKALSMTREKLRDMPDGDVLSMLKTLAGSALTQRG